MYPLSTHHYRQNPIQESTHIENMNQNHVTITIDPELLKTMKSQMKEPPKLLNKSAGKTSCSIFRVPQSLLEINKEAYLPRIVSIGPYHHQNNDLEMIQQHKWRFLDDMIRRTGKELADFMRIMVSMEKRIRESYSESIDRFGTNELAQLMVLDGVFLIELFRKAGKVVSIDQDDPIFKMDWIPPFLMRDLVRIENQIPFFVLQRLFDASIGDSNSNSSSNNSNNSNSKSLQSLILKFFNHAVDRKEHDLNEYETREGKHLLDFLRQSYTKGNKGNGVGVGVRVVSEESDNPSLKLIQPATKLVTVGVKFKADLHAKSFLDIEFRKGWLSIPRINMDDFHSSFLMNCVAFEQCYVHCSNDITTYVVFMGCLMNTSADVGLLSQNKIIENYFGTDKEIAKFFNDVGKDVSFNIKSNYLKKLFIEVNEYCENGWHVGWAGFKHTYFESPWAAISAFAAFMLLSLAALQTFYTVFPYYHKRD